MIITDNPRHKKTPAHINTHERKMQYFSTGQVTVGRFCTLGKDGLDYFYLPRLRGANIMMSRGYRHKGYRSPDQALSAGYVIRKNMQEEK